MMWFIVALCMERVAVKLGGSNYGAKYNGIGAVDDTVNRTADAPMAYRVLFPAVIISIERVFHVDKRHRVTLLYTPLKLLATTIMLALGAYVFTPAWSLLYAAIIQSTFYYDYWEWVVEICGLLAALSGDLTMVLIAAVLWPLSRESWVMLAPTYYLTTWDWYGSVLVIVITLCISTAVKLWVGKKEIYNKGMKMSLVNLDDIRSIFSNRPWYLSETAFALLITVATVWAVAFHQLPAWPIPLVYLIINWMFTRAVEIRVFSPCLVWVTLALIGG